MLVVQLPILNRLTQGASECNDEEETKKAEAQVLGFTTLISENTVIAFNMLFYWQ